MSVCSGRAGAELKHRKLQYEMDPTLENPPVFVRRNITFANSFVILQHKINISTQSHPNRIAICCANSETITCAECSSNGKSDTSTFSCAIAPTKSSTYTKSYRGALTATYAAAIRATDFPAN